MKKSITIKLTFTESEWKQATHHASEKALRHTMKLGATKAFWLFKAYQTPVIDETCKHDVLHWGACVKCGTVIP